MYPAVFLDRDGVIIENRDSYIRSWKDVKFFPTSLKALRLLSNSPYKIVIITNQSVIGKGIISLAEAEDINRRFIQKIVSAGGRIDGIFLCPHAPQDACQCRKPLPGLIYQAADALSIDLRFSYLIGDALTDIQAGLAAGIPTNILVKTGRGLDQLQLFQKTLLPRILVLNRLDSAVARILANPAMEK